MDGNYPDYDRVIPAADDSSLEVDGRTLLAAIDTASGWGEQIDFGRAAWRIRHERTKACMERISPEAVASALDLLLL